MNAKTADKGVDLDLFGNVTGPIKDPRGRPSYAKSKENQLLVGTLAAAGWNQEQIGAYMQCDPKTLRKYFSRELNHGGLFLEGMALQVLVKKMAEGHIGATNKVIDIVGRDPRAQGGKGKPAEKPKSPPLGKKDQAILDAQDVPQGWAEIMRPGEKLK